MAEQPSLRDRAAAVGVEIHALRTAAALAQDTQTLVPLKEADRALKREFGRGENLGTDSYSAFKERLCEQLYQEDKAEERVVQQRIESLTANVRREVEDELAADRAQLQLRQDQAAEREEAVAEREREASPSYRARFAAAGAGVVLALDGLLRIVA